jgi:RNA polymerase sigma factor (sigma-70 family)
MAGDLPPELSFLEDGIDAEAQRRGWSGFLDRYNRLLLRAARTFGGDYDSRMDRYRFVVEALSRDDYKRLRGYRGVEGSSLTAWLVVVARRLCLDFERQRYGRIRSENPGPAAEQRLRRRLANLSGSDVEPDHLVDSDTPSADDAVLLAERHAALAAVLRRLEPRQQLILKLRFEDGRSVRDISDLLGMGSVFQAYRAIDAALATARRLLEAAGIDDPFR